VDVCVVQFDLKLKFSWISLTYAIVDPVKKALDSLRG
jgi:hypothetical protein